MFVLKNDTVKLPTDIKIVLLVIDMQHKTICAKLKSLQSIQIQQFIFTPSTLFCSTCLS